MNGHRMDKACGVSGTKPVMLSTMSALDGRLY